MSSRNFFKALGPGVIFAGASVGVSHIVQSTRAGALYGFSLLAVLILTFVFKWTFFEVGPRYVAATGENLMVGYRKLGPWALWIFILISMATMFPVQGAVTLVTTGVFLNVFRISISPVWMSAVILLACALLLILGRYGLLDKTMKVMMSLLAILTALAFFMALWRAPSHLIVNHIFPNLSELSLPFLLAFMGWMPAPIDIAVWNSFWCAERRQQMSYQPSLKETLADFHIGYWGTAVLAFFFLGLGALVMHGSGETFVSSAVGFTNQVLNLYAKSLGSWSYGVIAACAAVTMFSTTLSCLDAYSRIMAETVQMIIPRSKKPRNFFYTFMLLVMMMVTVFIIAQYRNHMKALVDFATILSFLTAPLLAWINIRVLTDKDFPKTYQPGKLYRIWSGVGMIYLMVFSLFYLMWRLF